MARFIRKLLLGWILPVALLPLATAAGAPKDKEIRRAQPVLPEGYAISQVDVRATILHMQSLAQDQQAKLTVQDGIIADQAKQLASALVHNDNVRATAVKLNADVGALSAALENEKWARLKDRIFGWPCAVLIGVGVGMFLLPVIKLGFRAGFKAVTGI